jgi:hypothetical protein
LFALAEGHDGFNDAGDPTVLRAIRLLLEGDVMANGTGARADDRGAVLEELETLMVGGYRVSRYLLSIDDSEGYQLGSLASLPGQTDQRAQRLAAYVLNEKYQKATADVLRLPSVERAIHHWGPSNQLLAAYGGREELALGWVWLVQDYGFLLGVADYEVAAPSPPRTDADDRSATP